MRQTHRLRQTHGIRQTHRQGNTKDMDRNMQAEIDRPINRDTQGTDTQNAELNRDTETD